MNLKSIDPMTNEIDLSDLYPIEYGIPIPEKKKKAHAGRAPSILNVSIKAHLVKMRPARELKEKSEEPDSFVIPKDKFTDYNLTTKEGRSASLNFVTNVVKRYKQSLSQQEQNNICFQIRWEFDGYKQPSFIRVTRNL